MRRFDQRVVDLFGIESEHEISVGEYYLMTHIASDECIDRADWALENLPSFDDYVMLDIEDYSLLEGGLKAYIFGLYPAVILSSDSFCERLLTDAIEIRGDKKSARRGFFYILKSARNFQILDGYILNRIERMHAIRNNFCHEKGPDSPWRIDKRALSARADHNQMIQADAREALCIMHGVVTRIKRSFPRLDLPGHPSIREELLRR